MGKAPAFQFYVLDYMDDADGLTASSNGIWIRMLCKLHRAPRRGEVTARMDAWCRKCNCTLAELDQFIEENAVENVANLTKHDGKLTVVSRRMERERKEREQANKRQREYEARKRQSNPLTDPDENVTSPSSTSYSSTSSSKEEGRDHPTYPFIEEARKIPGWNFDRLQEAGFFENLSQDYPADVIRKATRDLHAYQLSEAKPYKNPMRALRNWCAKEQEWQKERNEPEEKPEPAKDEQGNVLIPIDGELVPAPEFDRLIGEHAIYKTPEGWKRREAS